MDVLTPAALKSGLDYMGLTAVWFGGRCGVTKRTVFRWFDNVSPIPATATEEFSKVWNYTFETTVKMFTEVGAQTVRPLVLHTYRTDSEFWAATGSYEYPAAWHRALVVRVADRLDWDVVPVRIEYGTREMYC